MSRRQKRGQLVQVSEPQTVGEGRASRAKDARPLDLRRLDGEEGALAKLVFALSDPALFGEDCPAKDKAQERVRAARKRVRAVVGDETEARAIFAHAVVSAGERRILSTAHPTLRPHLIEQAVGAVKTSREFHVESWTARTEVAVASRLLATGLALLDLGSAQLDVETLKAAAALVGQSQRMRDGALDTDRRAKAARPPAPFPWLANAQPQERVEAEDDDRDEGASTRHADAVVEHHDEAHVADERITDNRAPLHCNMGAGVSPERPRSPPKLNAVSTRWDHALGKMVPLARDPAPAAPSPAPRRAPAPRDVAPPRPTQGPLHMQQDASGFWAPAPLPTPRVKP